MALEPAFWEALSAIAATEGRSLSALVAQVDAGRDALTPLASALRLRALNHFRAGR